MSFKKQRSNIARFVENKNLKTISLNEEKFLARRSQFTAEKDEEQVISEKMNANEITRDFYLDEVLRITADYTRLLYEPTQFTAADRS